jgi:hypothetical protein
VSAAAERAGQIGLRLIDSREEEMRAQIGPGELLLTWRGQDGDYLSRLEVWRSASSLRHLDGAEWRWATAGEAQARHRELAVCLGALAHRAAA